jgi:hypothetical protein
MLYVGSYPIFSRRHVEHSLSLSRPSHQNQELILSLQILLYMVTPFAYTLIRTITLHHAAPPFVISIYRPGVPDGVHIDPRGRRDDYDAIAVVRRGIGGGGRRRQATARGLLEKEEYVYPVIVLQGSQWDDGRM